MRAKSKNKQQEMMRRFLTNSQNAAIKKANVSLFLVIRQNVVSTFLSDI